MRLGSVARSRICAGFLAFVVGAACGCQAARASYRPVDGGDARRGAVALTQYGCGSCHVIPGIGRADGMVGPPLLWFARRTVLAGRFANTSEQLVQWLMDPQEMSPGTAMPNLGVTPKDARDIAAYLYTLR